jgi:ABC-type bacteriocin/lantibiotic exporter with double-glycine peptidase domain
VILGSKDYLNHIFKETTSRKIKSGITEGSVTFKNVKFRYDKSQTGFVFDDLNLHFDAGKTYALVGQSGGGKTTMMKMLAGLYTPESGAVYIDNVDVKDVDLEYLRSNVNYINQRTNLFNESIMYNMLYGNPNVTEEEVIEKLNKYNLMKVFDLPDGVNSSAGIQGGNLSGGMQRVTILMRGMLKPGQIVVIDEPTTGLDADTTKKVADMIFTETEGKTLIIITHSESIRGLCNVVYDVEKLK